MTNLAPESLFDMLEEAEKYRTRKGGLKWRDVFRTRFEGKWVVLHAPVKPGENGLLVDIPIAVGPEQTPATVRNDIAILDALPSNDGTILAVTAAQLAGCELDNEGDEWIVTLNPRTGFLWSHTDSLRSLGFFESEWIDEEEVAALLDTQSALTGAAP